MLKLRICRPKISAFRPQQQSASIRR